VARQQSFEPSYHQPRNRIAQLTRARTERNQLFCACHWRRIHGQFEGYETYVTGPRGLPVRGNAMPCHAVATSFFGTLSRPLICY